jgi:hypothetical protein
VVAAWDWRRRPRARVRPFVVHLTHLRWYLMCVVHLKLLRLKLLLHLLQHFKLVLLKLRVKIAPQPTRHLQGTTAIERKF